jgi:hypothetical protein
MSPLCGRKINFGDLFRVLFVNLLLICTWLVLLTVVSGNSIKNGEDIFQAFLFFTPVSFLLTLSSYGVAESRGKLGPVDKVS